MHEGEAEVAVDGWCNFMHTQQGIYEVTRGGNGLPQEFL